MARAGFFPIQAAQIRFGKDGRWYADGEPITNARIADLFSRHICREGDGRYTIRMADERAVVEVEDTPFVVLSASRRAGGSIVLELNDRSEEALDPHTLEVGAHEVLYCRVKQGSERARFLRPAYYQLAQHIVETAPGAFALRTEAQAHPIRRPAPGR